MDSVSDHKYHLSKENIKPCLQSFSTVGQKGDLKKGKATKTPWKWVSTIDCLLEVD